MLVYPQCHVFQRSGSSLKRIARFADGTHNETWQCNGYYEAIARFSREVDAYRHADGGATGGAGVNSADTYTPQVLFNEDDDGGGGVTQTL